MKLKQLGVTLNAANLLESNRLSWIRMDITIINEAMKLTTELTTRSTQLGTSTQNIYALYYKIKIQLNTPFD